MGVVQDIRDIVIIIVGIVWSIVYLGILAVVAVAGVLITRYMGKAQALLDEQGRSLLLSAQNTADSVRDRTAALPHYELGTEAARQAQIRRPRTARGAGQLKLSFPFFRRKKPWYQRLLRQ